MAFLIISRSHSSQYRGSQILVLTLALWSLFLFTGNRALATSSQADTLTGLLEFGTSSNGAYKTFDWNTIGGDVADNLYIVQGSRSGAFLNSGDGASTALNMQLTPGTYSFSIFGDDYFDFSPVQSYGLNLFFDGSNSTPSISVFAPLSTTTTPTAFSADSQVTPFLGPFTSTTATTVNGAGTLSFIDGPESITLTSYSWSNPNVYNLDRVSNHTTTPNGDTDFVGQFTLLVSPVPEPTSVCFLGFAAIGLLKRHRQ